MGTLLEQEQLSLNLIAVQLCSFFFKTILTGQQNARCFTRTFPAGTQMGLEWSSCSKEPGQMAEGDVPTRCSMWCTSQAFGRHSEQKLTKNAAHGIHGSLVLWCRHSLPCVQSKIEIKLNNIWVKPVILSRFCCDSLAVKKTGIGVTVAITLNGLLQRRQHQVCTMSQGKVPQPGWCYATPPLLRYWMPCVQGISW